MDGNNQASYDELRKPEVWYTKPQSDVLRKLQTTKEGLSDSEAANRLSYFGPNVIEKEEGLTRWQILVHQFKDPLIYILLFAAFITFVLQDYIDSGVIMAVVFLNAVIGYIQETKAQKAIQALSGLTAPKAHVIRNGQEMEIPGRDLVPGDIVLLTSGGKIAADLRIIQSQGLEVDESTLTGESMVVSKVSDTMEKDDLVPGDQDNMLFSGTIAVRGRAKAVVVRTGRETELGRIADSVKRVGITQTPIQEKVDKMGNRIGIMIIGFAVFISVVGVIYQMSPYEIFITVVAMVVSAIPEGLPVILTVTLAIGVRRMSARQAIIRSLPAVETLGSTTIIGSDKTGTLTQNQMTVSKIWADGNVYSTSNTGYELDGEIIGRAGEVVKPGNDGLYHSLLAGTLANEADVKALKMNDPKGDPTEIALHVTAHKGGIDISDLRHEAEQTDLFPFESENQYMGTLNRMDGKTYIFLKGSPETILDKCSGMLENEEIVEINRNRIQEEAEAFAGEGLRVIAMAHKVVDDDFEKLDPKLMSGGFIFDGLQGMEDPIRPEALEAIRVTKKAGIRVIMITGDHLGTARSIGRKLGLDTSEGGALEGREIENLDDAELDQILSEVNIFARVSPQHKLRIVERLKALEHIVAVTGDGVNDAPALRAAHLGVSMGKSGTDVAREASDMVLSDDNFATITAAIEEGRVVFSNIRKVTFFLLSTASGEMMVILAAIIMNWPLPFIAVQILWINMVTNGLQDLALAFEPGEKGILKRSPRPVKEGILTRRLVERLGGVGLVMAAGTLGIFWWTMEQTGDLQTAQSVAMTQMVVFQFFHVLNCRSLDRSIFQIPFFSNRFLFISLSAALAAHLAVLHVGFLQTIFRTVALSQEQWIWIVAIGAFIIIGGEIDKFVNRWRKNFIG
ncbi:MAG: cation-translocating P-type ATPase [Bacteroidota bacterium]